MSSAAVGAIVFFSTRCWPGRRSELGVWLWAGRKEGPGKAAPHYRANHGPGHAATPLTQFTAQHAITKAWPNPPGPSPTTVFGLASRQSREDALVHRKTRRFKVDALLLLEQPVIRNPDIHCLKITSQCWLCILYLLTKILSLRLKILSEVLIFFFSLMT